MESGLIAALGSVCVLLGYTIIKKISRSRCHSDSGCIQCDTAVQMVKQNSQRLDNITELIMQLAPQKAVSPKHQVSLQVTEVADSGAATI